ncbi:MAG: tyrosine-type recombinase/integrase [Acidobacteria bacterium]|nr:tyrosine-type recombinase/integrase [Acidobacteriota bacterium]
MGSKIESISPDRLIEDFCDFLREAGNSQATIRNRRGDIKALVTWSENRHGYTFNAQEFISSDIDDYRDFLLAGFKVATANRRVTSMNVFFRWVAARGLIKRQQFRVLKHASRAGNRTSPPRLLDAFEQNQLINSVESAGDLNDIVAIRLMIECGLRVAELCSLRWNDVINVDNSGILALSSPHVKSITRREIPLPDKTREALVSLRQTRISGPTSYVLNGRAGPITRSGIEFLVSRHAKRAALENVTAKALRHTYILNLVRGGVDLGSLTMLLGNGIAELASRYGSIWLRGSQSEHKY